MSHGAWYLVHRCWTEFGPEGAEKTKAVAVDGLLAEHGDEAAKLAAVRNPCKEFETLSVLPCSTFELAEIARLRREKRDAEIEETRLLFEGGRT